MEVAGRDMPVRLGPTKPLPLAAGALVRADSALLVLPELAGRLAEADNPDRGGMADLVGPVVRVVVERVPAAGPVDRVVGAKPDAPRMLCLSDDAPPDTLRFAGGRAGDEGGFLFSPAAVERANVLGSALGNGIPVLVLVGVGRGIPLAVGGWDVSDSHAPPKHINLQRSLAPLALLSMLERPWCRNLPYTERQCCC